MSFVDDLKQEAFELVRGLPWVQRQLLGEEQRLAGDVDRDLKSKCKGLWTEQRSLPEKGMSGDEVLALLAGPSALERGTWAAGKVSGAVYYGEDAHTAVLNAAFSLYSLSNPLHPDTWPSGMVWTIHPPPMHRLSLIYMFVLSVRV